MPKRKRLTAREKLVNKTDRVNKKRLAEAEKASARAPLFADEVRAAALAEKPLQTPDEVYWHWRRNVALAADGRTLGGLLLDSLTEQKLRRLARECLPAGVFAGLDGYRLKTYPRSPEYGVQFWKKVLTGGRVVFAWKKVPDPSKSLGFRVEPDGVSPPDGWRPPYTEGQVHALFPPSQWEGRPHQPDDGGVWEKVCAALAASRAVT